MFQCKPSGYSALSLFPLMVMSVQEEIRSFGDCVDTDRGQTLERFEELLQMIHVSMNFKIYYMIGSPRIDDEIIYSLCFNFV